MPPRSVPTKLSNWPWVVVRVECTYCGRRGCYRLARLAAKYGPEQSITGLLADLAQDCPWWRNNPRKYEPRCAACFVDLDRNFPPGDHPDEPLYRQRQPGREDLPKPRHGDRFPATYDGGAPMLSGWPHPRIELACTACDRCGVFDVAALRASLPNGDMALIYLRSFLTDRCPSRKAFTTEQCQAVLKAPRDP